MTKSRRFLGAASVLALAGLLAAQAPASSADDPGRAPAAAAQGTDLWGGPGAKGAGSAGARFDTTLYVSAVAPAVGSVDFYSGGRVVASTPFSIPARGLAVLETPAALDGTGAWLYRVRADAAVSAWTETFNETPGGRFGVSFSAVSPSELLKPGDEASAGGAEASSDAARTRTNVGILCSGDSAQGCNLEVAVYQAGALLGTGSLSAGPGSVGQNSLANVVTQSSGRSGLSVRLRLLQGSGLPYLVRNNNQTSDGTAVPVSVARSAFSTAPVISSFTATPNTGCAPQTVTFAWTTQNATSVAISGVSGSLPASGSTTVTVNTSTDFVLTASSSGGETATAARRVDIQPPTAAPLPTPASATLVTGGIYDGAVPYQASQLTFRFTQQESTGSSFQILGNQYFYRAGSTPGTDIVEITVQGTCGPATATFTATVVAPGSPIIHFFTSDPAVGCGPSANVVLSWQTENCQGVQISGLDGLYPANGSYGVTINGTTTFTLTAFGVGSAKAQKALTVKVDTGLPAPLLTPNNITVGPGSLTRVTVSGVPELRNITWVYVQNQSGGFFDNRGAGLFDYTAGSIPGAHDIVRVYYGNGCGYIFTEFHATIAGN